MESKNRTTEGEKSTPSEGSGSVKQATGEDRNRRSEVSEHVTQATKLVFVPQTSLGQEEKSGTNVHQKPESSSGEKSQDGKRKKSKKRKGSKERRDPIKNGPAKEQPIRNEPEKGEPMGEEEKKVTSLIWDAVEYYRYRAPVDAPTDAHRVIRSFASYAWRVHRSVYTTLAEATTNIDVEGTVEALTTRFLLGPEDCLCHHSKSSCLHQKTRVTARLAILSSYLAVLLHHRFGDDRRKRAERQAIVRDFGVAFARSAGSQLEYQFPEQDVGWDKVTHPFTNFKTWDWGTVLRQALCETIAPMVLLNRFVAS